MHFVQGFCCFEILQQLKLCQFHLGHPTAVKDQGGQRGRRRVILHDRQVLTSFGEAILSTWGIGWKRMPQVTVHSWNLNINTKDCQVLIASFFSVDGQFAGCVVVAFQASILWNLNGRAFGHTAQKFFAFFLQVTSFLDFLLFARPPWQIQRQHRSNVCKSWPWQNHLTIGASYCRLALNHRSLFEA